MKIVDGMTQDEARKIVVKLIDKSMDDTYSGKITFFRGDKRDVDIHRLIDAMDEYEYIKQWVCEIALSAVLIVKKRLVKDGFINVEKMYTGLPKKLVDEMESLVVDVKSLSRLFYTMKRDRDVDVGKYTADRYKKLTKKLMNTFNLTISQVDSMDAPMLRRLFVMSDVKKTSFGSGDNQKYKLKLLKLRNLVLESEKDRKKE